MHCYIQPVFFEDASGERLCIESCEPRGIIGQVMRTTNMKWIGCKLSMDISALGIAAKF